MFVINRRKALKLILLFSVLNSSLFIGLTPNGFSLVRIITALFLNISVILLFIFSIKHEPIRFNIHLYFKSLLFLLFFWSLFVIGRDISLNVTSLITLFGHYLMAWAWVTPLAIVFGFNILNWINIFDFIGKLLLVGVILTIFILPIGKETYTFGVVEWVQFFPVLLLTYTYQKPLYRKVTILAIISFIFLSIANSQRVSVIYLGLAFIFFIMSYLRSRYHSIYKKTVLTLFLILSSVIVFFAASTIYNDVSRDKQATADTRTFLFVEMFSDMSLDEQIIGRGALGTYYSSYFAQLRRAHVVGGDSSTRSVNEIGYLEMILKGGYILMILNLLILIPAAFLGIFRSNNLIAQMSGYVIVFYLIIWTVSYYSVYSAEYLILWMAVGTAISSQARKMTDEELLNYMKKGNRINA